MVRRYIKQLKTGRACGIDGISAEHLKYACDSDLPLVISALFTQCFKWGLIPDIFTRGLLLPLPKANKDSNIANNLRPITISSITSKLIEMYINEQLSSKEVSRQQFGFIAKRGTTMAISLVHDVTKYMNNNGSPVYLCALDAQGAFDFIPHGLLLQRAADVLPDISWHLMAYWYRNMSVQIQWKGETSSPISVLRGTRQGALTSPTLFNFFYRSLIDELSIMNCGITINNVKYNVFNYADDILIASTTISGLQKLLNKATQLIMSQGLCFNPQKTECCVIGQNKQPQLTPSWQILGSNLHVSKNIQYLGAVLGDDCGQRHAQDKISQMNKAFYSLQGAGLNEHGLNPLTAARVFSAAVEPVLTYGCESILLDKGSLESLDKAHAKLVKSMVGLSKYSRSTPLLKALGLMRPTEIIRRKASQLLKQCIYSESATRDFYLYAMRTSDTFIKGTLPWRANIVTTVEYNIDDGITDSVRYLLQNYDENDKVILKILLKPF